MMPGGHPGVLACFKWIHECTHVWLIHVCAYMINPMRSCEYVYLACACTVGTNCLALLFSV